MHSSFHRTSINCGMVVRSTVLAVLASCGAVSNAQATPVPNAPPDTLPALDLSHPALSLQAALQSSLGSSSNLVGGSGSSSSSSNSAALSADPSPALGSNEQPPPRRRRYGRPNYSDKYRNADGSNRLAFNVGAGLNIPVGSASSNYLNTRWRAQAGGGVNFNKKLGVILQFDYDHFGLPGGVLSNQGNLYRTVTRDNTGAFTRLGGSSHIWSFTANPTFNIVETESLGAYVVVGGGFYHKVTDFTVPQVGQYCDYYGYCYQYQTNQIIDHYSSNAPGANGGVGLTYKFSRWSNERLFAEARFVHTFNKARLADSTLPGQPAGGTPFNFYPPNSNETSYIPITVGIRF